jgi:Ger(x)C family germination protein
LVTTEAPTIAEAYALARKRVGRFLDITHTQLILVSDQIAQGGLRDNLDYLIRVENLQHIAYLCTTRGPTTAILQARPRLSGGLAFYLLEILTREGNRTPQILPVYLWEAFAILNEPGQDLTLPIFAFNKQLASQVEIEGTALFRGDRMVGSLTGEDTRFLSLLMNQEVTFDLAVPHNSGKLVMRIERAWARNRLTGAQGANPTPAIDVKARLVIEQMIGVPLWLPTEKRAVEAKTAESLAREAERVLGLMQAVGSDPIGFGRHYYNAYGGRVDMTKWGVRYRQVRFLVRARTTLQRTNFLSR